MKVQKAQAVLQYLTPVIVLLYYLVTVGIAACTLQKGRKPKSYVSRQITFCLLWLIVAAYFAQSGIVVADSLSTAPRASSAAANVKFLVLTLLQLLLR